MNVKDIVRPFILFCGAACIGIGIGRLISYSINGYWLIGIGLLLIILLIIFRKQLASQ